MFTRKDFYDHLINNNCEVGDFDGINRTANQIEIINKKTKAYFYIATPIDDRIVPRFIIERACTRLGIPLPKHF